MGPDQTSYFSTRFRVVEYASIILLVLSCLTIFGVALLPVDTHKILYKILYSLLFVFSVVALRTRRGLFVVALLAFTTEWTATFFEAEILILLSRLTNVLFFIFVVIKLIIQIARNKEVTSKVIMEAVTGYLLLGLVFSILVLIIAGVHPEAYSFGGETAGSIADITYFTFVTFSTLGYGDLLPLIPASKSLTLMTAISGQLYLAIIVATLIGKFLNQPDG